jgi:hypothetical protein
VDAGCWRDNQVSWLTNQESKAARFTHALCIHSLPIMPIMLSRQRAINLSATVAVIVFVCFLDSFCTMVTRIVNQNDIMNLQSTVKLQIFYMKTSEPWQQKSFILLDIYLHSTTSGLQKSPQASPAYPPESNIQCFTVVSFHPAIHDPRLD